MQAASLKLKGLATPETYLCAWLLVTLIVTLSLQKQKYYLQGTKVGVSLGTTQGWPQANSAFDVFM